MKVSLKNIGMLDEAEFEVGELTLICGENNTGKTYATYSLYGYLKFINDRYPQEVITSFNQVGVENTKLKIEIEILSNFIKSLLSHYNKEYKKELSEIFAGKESDFHKSVFEAMPCSRYTIDDANNNIGTLKSIFDSPDNFTFTIENNLAIFDFTLFVANNKQKIQGDGEVLRKVYLGLIAFHICHTVFPSPFILSVERTGATMFHKELDVNKSEIVDVLSRTDTKNIQQITLDILRNRYARYPKPVKDNIYFVREIDEISNQVSFIKKDEKNIMHQEVLDLLYNAVGGKYMSGQDGIEFAPGAKKRVTRGKFAVQRASSSVRSLLMLNYYILHVAKRGDILMIDEPELNLHPKNQILIARLLSLLVNIGIKVFITTHSDFIVRELSNCIMLNNLSATQIEKINKNSKEANAEYTKTMGLEASKVKAYLAHNDKGKNTLKSVHISQEEGIFMETFDAPIDKQNENQGNIFEEVLRKASENGNK